jgi:streptogramin lyase
VSDFLTELRSEVLEAHAARRRRSPWRRLVRALGSEAPRALAAAGAVAALVVAVIGVRAVTPQPTAPPRVVDVIRVDGNPTDAVLANGSVWVSDFAGHRVARLEPSTRRVLGRIASNGQPVALAAGRDGVWVRTAVGDGGRVARLGSNVGTRVGYGATLAVNDTAVWAADVELGPERIRRIDPGTGRDTGTLDIPGVYAMASGGESLWAVATQGTLLRLDGRTGALRSRWPALAISAGTAAPALVADARGAWVLQVGQDAASQAIRLEGDRIVRRLPIPPSARPLLTVAPDGLWTVTEDALHHRFAAVRLDPRDGSVTGQVDLGDRNPISLLTVNGEIWMTSSDGRISVIDG